MHERSQNTTPTSLATCISGRTNTRRSDIDANNGAPSDREGSSGELHRATGEHVGEGKVELQDVLVIETTDGKKYEFEIVGVVEDDENNAFAVAYSENADEFVVTDQNGKLLDDDALAQEILDDFFVLAEESSAEEH